MLAPPLEKIPLTSVFIEPFSPVNRLSIPDKAPSSPNNPLKSLERSPGFFSPSPSKPFLIVPNIPPMPPIAAPIFPIPPIFSVKLSISFLDLLVSLSLVYLLI